MDVYEVRVYYSNTDGKRSQNVIHYMFTIAPLGTDPFVTAGDLLAVFDTDNSADLQSALCVDTTITAYTARKVNDGGGPTNVRFVNLPGSVAGDSLTMLASANLRLIPAMAPYARKTGHIYIPSIPELYCDTDVYTSEGLSAYNALALSFATPMTVDTGTANVCIYDRTTSTGAPISQIQLAPTVTGMRRRSRPKIG